MEIELLAFEGASVGAGSDLYALVRQGTGHADGGAFGAQHGSASFGHRHDDKKYVEAIAGTGCTLLDTRKTIPGLRMLEKYATRMGGATNHRMGVSPGMRR